MSFPDWGSSGSQGRICLIPTVSFHQRVTSNFSAKGFKCAFSTFNRRLVFTVTSGLLVHPNNLTLFLRLVLQLQVRVKIVRQLPIGMPCQRIHRFQVPQGYRVARIQTSAECAPAPLLHLRVIILLVVNPEQIQLQEGSHKQS